MLPPPHRPQELDLPAFARLACALLDVPVAQDAGPRALLEAVHHLFSLLVDGYRSSPFFARALDGIGGGGGVGGGGAGGCGVAGNGIMGGGGIGVNVSGIGGAMPAAGARRPTSSLSSSPPSMRRERTPQSPTRPGTQGSGGSGGGGGARGASAGAGGRSLLGSRGSVQAVGGL